MSNGKTEVNFKKAFFIKDALGFLPAYAAFVRLFVNTIDKQILLCWALPVLHAEVVFTGVQFYVRYQTTINKEGESNRFVYNSPWIYPDSVNWEYRREISLNGLAMKYYDFKNSKRYPVILSYNLDSPHSETKDQQEGNKSERSVHVINGPKINSYAKVLQ